MVSVAEQACISLLGRNSITDFIEMRHFYHSSGMDLIKRKPGVLGHEFESNEKTFSQMKVICWAFSNTYSTEVLILCKCAAFKIHVRLKF